MNDATPSTPVEMLRDARFRAGHQRRLLAFLATEVSHLIDARAQLHRDIADAAAALELGHLDWHDLADLHHLHDVDRSTDVLAALHHLIERALGI